MESGTKSLKMNAFLNMLRRGSAIVFPLVTFSYASHKLGAASLGIFSFCNSVISYFLLLAALGISTYAVREGQAVREKTEELTRFVSEIYTINVLMTIVSYVLLVVLVLIWGKLKGYSEIVFLLSISIAMTTIGADWINVLLEDFLYITLRYIGVQLLCFVLLVLLVREPGDLYKYALISAISAIGGNLFNVWYIRRRIHFHLTNRPHFRKHICPMLTLFSNDLAIKLYLIADIIILGILVTEKQVGIYTVSSKVYTSIKEVINAMILVTVPRFSFYLSHRKVDSYRHSFNSVCNGVITFMLPCIIGLMFQAENIVYYLGGAEYVSGTDALQILAIAMLFAVGACLLSQSVLIPNKMEKYYLIATVTAAVSNIVLNFILIPLWGINAAALTTLLSEIIVFGIMLYKSRPVAPHFELRHSDVFSALAGSICIAVVCALFSHTIHSRITNMCISIIVSVLVYIVVICLLRNQTAEKLLKSIRGTFIH